MFRLNPALDRKTIAATFAAEGHVQVRDFLHPDDAAALHAEMRRREDWKQVVNSGDKVFDLDRPTRAAMSTEQRAALDQAVHAGAREGFQHRYEAIRVPDAAAEREASDDPFAKFALWLSSGEARDFLRSIIARPELDFADAQATAYAPDDFLTSHTDAIEGKGRLAAYVFGLTPAWRPEWGGLLLFHDDDGDIARGLTPRFNALNLFAVPRLHSVSIVTRAAPYRRYAVTGWLRRD
ncbi:MAG: 2OG-Fe(II) oxygenase [Sphingomonas sp.]|nr:2OG-Fe(II) oxygenase [Sphingomonas sp.]